MKNQDWLNVIQWNEQGLVPVITQDISTNRVLMLAWINRTALEKTLQCGEAVYWSRSRNRLWHKGEESGHIQKSSIYVLIAITMPCYFSLNRPGWHAIPEDFHAFTSTPKIQKEISSGLLSIPY